MIADLWAAIDATMKAQGFTMVESEGEMQDRRYRLMVGEMTSANENRGAFNSGVVRIDRAVEIRIRYSGERASARRQLVIATDQERIVHGIYTMGGHFGRFDTAVLEEESGDFTSVMRFVFPGQIV